VVDRPGAADAALAGLVVPVEGAAPLAAGVPMSFSGLEAEARQELPARIGVACIRADAVEAQQRVLRRNLRVPRGEGLVARLDDRQLEPEPSGSEKRKRPSSRETATLWPRSRSSQKSSDSVAATRQTTRCTIPAPARPRRAPGYSKKVMSAPGLPSSSA